jgi:hypothetical protein
VEWATKLPFEVMHEHPFNDMEFCLACTLKEALAAWEQKP